MKHGDVIVLSSGAQSRKMALAIAEVMSHPVYDELVGPEVQTRKSRGKGKKRKQWDLR